jgi:hypothetical protein
MLSIIQYPPDGRRRAATPCHGAGFRHSAARADPSAAGAPVAGSVEPWDRSGFDLDVLAFPTAEALT